MNYKVGIVFDVNSGKFKTEIAQNTQQVKSFGNATQNTSGQVTTFNRAVDSSNKTLTTTTKIAASVRNSLAGVAAGFGAFNLAQGLTTQLAAFQDIRVRLQGLSADAQEYADKERFLIDLASTHHKELNGLADGYSRLSALTKENIITDETARTVLEGLSNAASQNGASGEDLQRVYFGLSQALGAGTVNMEDFRQVTEPLPDLMSKIARAAGFETSAGLKQLIGTGTLTSSVFGDLLVKALSDYDGAAAKTANNINAKYNDIKLQYQLLAVALEAPINDALLPTLDGLADGLNFLSENVDGVINVLQVGLVVAAGHAANAITKKTTTTLAGITASKAASAAAIEQASAEQRLATSANQRAIQEQAAATRQLANAKTTFARTAAIKNLAIANGQAAASEQALAAARGNLAAATTRLSVASRGLSLLSATVGGLPGLLTLAAFGMYELATSTGEAADETKRLNKENEQLNPFANYNFDQASRALLRYQGQLSVAKELAEETRVRFENPFFKNVTADDVNNANKEIESLTNKIAALQAIVKKPEAEGNKASPNKNAPEALKQGQTLLNNLSKQAALYGVTSEEAKARYAIEEGALKGINEQLAEQIIKQAALVDSNKVDQQQTADTTQGFTALEQSLQSEEQRITTSYAARQQILEDALSRELVSKGKAAALSKQLDEQQAAEIRDFRQGLADEAAEDLQEAEDEKARELRERRESEILGLQNFNSRKEAEEFAHNERLFQAKTANTGQLQGTLLQFANFEKKTALDKTSAVIGLGEQGFQAFAGQSKKAFAISKAFSIGQALISTYQAATSAYAALAPIPIVGPVLGAAAAVAAIGFGVAQVNAIRSQQPPGFENGGRIGNNNIIEFGERNKPEVLEFGGRNYLLGGNGGAVFNQSQLQEVNNTNTNSVSNANQNAQGGDITLNYAPVMQQAVGQEFSQQLTEHADQIIELVRSYKNDNGEEF